MNWNFGTLVLTAFVATLNASVGDASTQVSQNETHRQVTRSPSSSSAQPFLTEAMIASAKPFFDHPYQNDPGQAITKDGITIYRPNHGIIQGARVAAVMQDLIRVLLAKPAGDEMQTWLQTKLAKDPAFARKISMMALLHRSGRTDESDSIRDPAKRVQELTTSASNFAKAAATSGITFTSQEIQDYQAAIMLDGKMSGGTSDQIHLTRLLRSAHAIDLIRDGMEEQDEATSRLPLTQGEAAQETARDQVYLNLTGVTGGFTDTFFELSNTPKDLAKVLDQAEVNGWTPDQGSSGTAQTKAADLSGVR